MWHLCAKQSEVAVGVCYYYTVILQLYLYLFQWHLGMFAKEYTPLYRGFESHFGYYQGCEDYYDHTYEANPVRNYFLLVCQCTCCLSVLTTYLRGISKGLRHEEHSIH